MGSLLRSYTGMVGNLFDSQSYCVKNFHPLRYRQGTGRDNQQTDYRVGEVSIRGILGVLGKICLWGREQYVCVVGTPVNDMMGISVAFHNQAFINS